MGHYVKLFSTIIHSTIWREEDFIRIVWITMLVMADKNGIVECSVPGLADAARVTLQECILALQRFQEPDEYSQNPNNGGRRIEKIPGGFEILNYEEYRQKFSDEERRERNATKQKRWRERKLFESNPALPTVTESNPALPTVTESNPALPVVTDVTLLKRKEKKEERILLLTPLKRDNTSNNNYNNNITRKYIDIFNAVFDRKGGPVKTLSPIIEKRMKEEIPVWQILAAPILISVSSVNRGLFSRPNLSEILLRDGTHMVRGPNGSSPGINWIRDLVLGIDMAVLDQKHTMIAQHFDVFEDLKDKVKSYWTP